MRPIWLAGVLLLAPAAAQAALDGDPERGARLYEQNCLECHDRSVHKREEVRATNQREIVSWITRRCSRNAPQLSTQDLEDLATYLNEQFYHYKE
jgi:mono/diheme cytochrome c family protein